MREEELKNEAAEAEAEQAAAAEEAKQPEAEAPAAEEVPPQAEKKSKFGKKSRDDKQLEAMKTKLEAAEKEAAELKDKLLRTVAEYDNFRKRSAREKDESFNNGLSYAVEQLLPILDTLGMAAAAPCSDDNYKKGVEMTLNKADSSLTALKVEEIAAQDQPFDPNYMNAVQQVPAGEGVESGTVVQVFQKGYKLGDKVIRHATVVVAE